MVNNVFVALVKAEQGYFGLDVHGEAFVLGGPFKEGATVSAANLGTGRFKVVFESAVAAHGVHLGHRRVLSLNALVLLQLNADLVETRASQGGVQTG